MARETKILLGNCFLFSDLWKDFQGGMTEIKTKAGTPEKGDIFSVRKRIQEKKSPVFFTREGYRARNFLAFNHSSSDSYLLWSKSRKIKNVDGLAYKNHLERNPRIHLREEKVPLGAHFKNIWEANNFSDLVGLKNRFSFQVDDFFRSMPLARAWNVSLAGAMIFGMLSMTMVYRYLGQSVSARMQLAGNAGDNQIKQERVLGEDDFNSGIDPQYITKILSEDGVEGKELSSSEFEKKIREMVKGYPIEQMVPYIAKQNHVTAAFLVAIAKKESAWGKRVPVLDGKDCYNYWGYRGIRSKMGSGGHTCFDSPEDAVNSVAKRIDFLVSKKELNTPEKMVVWKCGYDCSWDSKWAVKKWISDVDMYFQQLNEE